MASVRLLDCVESNRKRLCFDCANSTVFFFGEFFHQKNCIYIIHLYHCYSYSFKLYQTIWLNFDGKQIELKLFDGRYLCTSYLFLFVFHWSHIVWQGKFVLIVFLGVFFGWRLISFASFNSSCLSKPRCNFDIILLILHHFQHFFDWISNISSFF